MDAHLLEWPLTAGDVVVDGGAHIGEWAKAIAGRYGCRVEAYEMMPVYAASMMGIAKVLPVTVHPVGLAEKDGTDLVVDVGASSSVYLPKSGVYHLVQVRLRDAVSALEELGVDEIALLKLNIEGGEFGVLERLGAAGWLKRIRRLLVQFHRGLVENCERRRDLIRGTLNVTHRELWCYPWEWEAWELK